MNSQPPAHTIPIHATPYEDLTDLPQEDQDRVNAMLSLLAPAAGSRIPLTFGPYQLKASWHEYRYDAGFGMQDDRASDPTLMLVGTGEAEGDVWTQHFNFILDSALGLPDVVDITEWSCVDGVVHIKTDDPAREAFDVPQGEVIARVAHHLRGIADRLTSNRRAFGQTVESVFGVGEVKASNDNHTVTVYTPASRFGQHRVCLRLRLTMFGADRVGGDVEMLTDHPLARKGTRTLPYLPIGPVKIGQAPPLAEAVARAFWQLINKVREWAGLIMAGFSALGEGVFPSWQSRNDLREGKENG